MARLPKPTAVLKLEKGKLYDQQRDRAELEPVDESGKEPLCPARFINGERKIWKELGAILKNYGLFTVANAPMLELLSTAWAQYISISAKINTGTLAERIILNDQKIDRLFKKQHQLADRIKGYLQELGLSSLGIAKLGQLASNARKKKNEMESLLD